MAKAGGVERDEDPIERVPGQRRHVDDFDALIDQFTPSIHCVAFGNEHLGVPTRRDRELWRRTAVGCAGIADVEGHSDTTPESGERLRRLSVNCSSSTSLVD